jgi:hypothetical protein
MRSKLIFSIMLMSMWSVPVAAQGLSTYYGRSPAFTVKYPSTFQFSRGVSAKTETAFGDPGRGKKLVTFIPIKIVKRYHGWYEFNVWISDDPASKCGSPAEGADESIPLTVPESGAKTRKVDGQTLSAYFGSEGGMSKSLSLYGIAVWSTANAGRYNP